MKMLLYAMILVLFTTIDGEHSAKGLAKSMDMWEMNQDHSQTKQQWQVPGTILDKESVSKKESLRKNFYNQIVARSCGASACCSKKGGLCMTNDQPCPGKVTDDCLGKSCICCIPTCSCKDKCKANRCCTRVGGTCITTNQACYGTLKPRMCQGSTCSCCIPE